MAAFFNLKTCVSLVMDRYFDGFNHDLDAANNTWENADYSLGLFFFQL